MIKDSIAKVVRGNDLTEGEMEMCMTEIISGKATPAQIGAFITALRLKGETIDEITGATRAMRTQSVKIQAEDHLVNIDRDEINVEEETILEISGTGGAATKTFNVSTACAFVAAGAGVKVAKHGSRTVSHLCGSADVVENLGVKLDITTSDVERCIREVGIGFLYAPIFHGTVRYAAIPRQEIGIRTIFNLLGPLTNPAGASIHVLGVYEPNLTEKIAQVLKRLETKSAFVVYGEDTRDEISICGSTRISHLRNGEIETFDLTPEEAGFKRAHLEDIKGGNAFENARIIREVLYGQQGPKRDIVLLNAAVVFVAAGLDSNFQEGIKRAKDSVDSGRAKEKLEHLIDFTQQCKSFVRKGL
ncbi:MAG TPA: anthranilate phosphoribosyltransferase [Deltaproteobacteria bacterium]|nr:anthranilate phosphoribosyltransferase [Deltaproteobacteria bacterium]